MKINDTELEIVKNYVIKSKQERIIWEFENAEKSVVEAHRDIC